VGARDLVLKCPDHLWFLGALFDVFPDADVIWTHRDPAKALPSYAAQMVLPARQYMGRVDPRIIGARLLSRFRQGIERAGVARHAHRGANIVDVHFSALATDPVGTVLSALRRLGHEPDQEHEQAMRSFMLSRPANARPVHHYRAEAYGLHAITIRAEFADYLSEYRITLEP
jgi:Sulfotransferase family